MALIPNARKPINPSSVLNEEYLNASSLSPSEAEAEASDPDDGTPPTELFLEVASLSLNNFCGSSPAAIEAVEACQDVTQSNEGVLLRESREQYCEEQKGIDDDSQILQKATGASAVHAASKQSSSLEGRASEVKATQIGKRVTNATFQSFIDQDVILLAFDVKCTCQGDNLTEIGLAWLDTREISGPEASESGDRGINWQPRMQSKHFRTLDFPHNAPKDCRPCYNKGSPTSYQFGVSEWVEISDLAATVNSFLDHLNRSPNGNTRKLVSVTWDDRLERKIDGAEKPGLNLGIFNSVHFLEGHAGHIDSQTHPSFGGRLRRIMYPEKPRIRMEDAVYGLGSAMTDLHNGGNDAVAELQNMMAMCDTTERQWAGTANGLRKLQVSWEVGKYQNERDPPVTGQYTFSVGTESQKQRKRRLAEERAAKRADH